MSNRTAKNRAHAPSVTSSKSTTSGQTMSRDYLATPRAPELDEYGRNSIIYSGPDGLRPHVTARRDDMFIGIGVRSWENTEALSYLFRAPPNQPFPKAKNGNISETGWESEMWGLTKGL